MPHILSKLAFDHTLFANICSKRKAQLQCNIICEMSWHKTFQKNNKLIYSQYNLRLPTDMHMWYAVLCSVSFDLLKNHKTFFSLQRNMSFTSHSNRQ